MNGNAIKKEFTRPISPCCQSSCHNEPINYRAPKDGRIMAYVVCCSGYDCYKPIQQPKNEPGEKKFTTAHWRMMLRCHPKAPYNFVPNAAKDMEPETWANYSTKPEPATQAAKGNAFQPEDVTFDDVPF